MNLTDSAKIPAQVMTRQIGEDLVILDLNSGTYFGLDPVGARIWELLAEGKTVGETCDTLINVYEVEPERLQQDVFNLMDTLFERGLITLEGE